MKRISDGVCKHELSNGLTVLVKENHSAPVVAIYTHVKAGYFNEPDNLVGISHIIEHMFFKGTEKRGVGQIAQETKLLGGFLNASTIYEQTRYYTVLPSKSFDAGLDIQADALLNSVFDAEELRKEIEVIIQEAKRKLDSPIAMTREKLFQLAFTKHRMRRWRIGNEEGLRKITRDDVVGFYHQYYRPENIILTVVGDVETSSVLHEVEKKYGQFAKGVLKIETSSDEPPQSAFKLGRSSGDIQQSYFAIGFHVPGQLHEDAYALEILAFILGGGRSSRFYQRIKEEKKLVHSISSYNYALQRMGMFMIEGIAESDRFHKSEAAVFEELCNLKLNQISEDELRKARNVLEATYVSTLESMSGQAGNLASYESMGDYRLVEDYLNKLLTVEADDILRVVETYFHADNCTVFEYVPQSVFPELENKEILVSRFSELLHATRQPTTESLAFEHPLPLMAFSKSDKADEPMQKLVLPNGLTLLLKELHQLPVISIGVFAKGSRSLESARNAGISWLCARSGVKGTFTRTAAQIATEIENLGSVLHYSAYPDYLGVSIKILSKHFTTGFDILSDVILNPVFPKKELTKEKTEALVQMTKMQDDMLQYPLQLFYRALFGDENYGLPVYGLPETVKRMRQLELFEWHHSHFYPENMTIVVVGDLNRSELTERIGERFSELENPDSCPERITRNRQICSGEKISREREKNQSALVLGFAGPPAHHDDIYALTILQNIVSGLGGRFFEELRGKQSLAYTVSAHLISRALAGAFLAYIATSPENEQRARDGLLKEFGKLKEKMVSKNELDRSVAYTKGVFQIGMERVTVQMSQYAHYELVGRGYKDVDQYAHKINSVQRQDVLRVAQKYFQLDTYCEGLVQGKL